MKQIHLFISGIVQGVFFRASAANAARRLGLVGWARNLPNGSVELMAEGEKAKLEKMIEWARTGPPGARIDHVDINWGVATGSFEDFRIG